MSVKVSSWVWHGDETADLSGNDMILMLALADVADDMGRCRFMTDDDDLTYSGLARKARVDRSTAIRVIARLRARGLVEQVKGSRARPNEFAIVVPWRKGGDLPPVEKVASATRKVASEPSKGGISDDHSSYRRIDVTDVTTSDVVDVLPTSESEVVRLSNMLADAVRANGHKVSVVGQTWWSACDRLMRLDGYSAEQIEWMIRWSTSDEFWSANIRSMSTLRDKFSTLVAQAKRKASRAPAPAERAASVIELGRRLQAEDEAAGRAS
ncbi:hypothetical protein CSIV_05100 [Microbacterium sp. CSI-V]|uniref:MarR family transcriptional regulator n=1 Tax=Microbacterium sp. CSI-V TaxID=1933777 RepID=UPI00097BD016|nr:MarR family transcriptional regulator [Microbacterium sp. CSI-V]ONI65657.1 hypothetical protein CSIV_05100 [Microbacterium sp. CSI-V]